MLLRQQHKLRLWVPRLLVELGVVGLSRGWLWGAGHWPGPRLGRLLGARWRSSRGAHACQLLQEVAVLKDAERAGARQREAACQRQRGPAALLLQQQRVLLHVVLHRQRLWVAGLLLAALQQEAVQGSQLAEGAG